MVYDYCLEAALESLLGVCDHVVVVEGNSTDNTYDYLRQMQNPKLTVLQSEWKPCAMGTYLSDLTNIARKALTTDCHISLQSDEVLHQDDYPLIRQLATAGSIYTMERLNFWLDHRHLLPAGEKVGSTIVRLAPTFLPCIGDAQGLEHRQGWTRSSARIFHYGFIRQPKAFAAKSREMQQAFFNTVDPIMDAVEREGLGVLGDRQRFATAVPREALVRFRGTHPKVAHQWLTERGYAL